MIELFDDDFGLSRNELLQKISTQLGAYYDGGEITAIRNNREYLMYCYLGCTVGYRVTVPDYFEIKTSIPYSHSNFSIRKSELTEWLAEHVLFMPDFQVGDAEFDAKFYIKVGNEEWGGKFFSNENIKLLISDILFKGFDVIRSDEGCLKVVKYGDKFPKVDMINNAIEQMGQIIADFPKS